MPPSSQEDKSSTRQSLRGSSGFLADSVKGGGAERQSHVMKKMRFRDYPDFNELVSPELPGPPPESLTLCNGHFTLDGVVHRNSLVDSECDISSAWGAGV